MRFILVLAFTVVLAACGSGKTGGKATTPPVTAVTTPSTAQLQARLLTVSDVGSSWNVGPAINSEDLSSVTQSIPCPDAAINPTIAKRLTAVTGIQFEPADRSYKHMIELAITGDPARLDSDLQTLFGALDACATTTSTATGTTKLTVKRLSIPDLGDQRAAFVMTGLDESAGSSATWYVRNAAVRVGPVAIMLGLTEILATPQDKPQISDESFVQLVQTAVGKLHS